MNDDGFAYFLRSQELGVTESGVRSHRVRSQESGVRSQKKEEERRRKKKEEKRRKKKKEEEVKALILRNF